MPYVSHNDDDRRRMLEAVGVSSFEELLTSIPENLRLKRPLDIPALSEVELLQEIGQLAEKNRGAQICFAGGGIYDQFVPAAVGSIISRPEFMTAYTPYQPEVAQGTLQVIYEFQTHICRLTGMEVSNASMYDGASAAAEAVAIASGVTRRSKVIVADTVNPVFRDVIRTYDDARGIELVAAPMAHGLTDLGRLEDLIDEQTAGVVVAQPNFFGRLEDIAAIEEMIHKVGGKLIVAVDPIAQVLLKTPGEYGADIVVGEGQPLGISMSYGGPLLGFFAAKKELVRSLPGRIAARTTDMDGKTGFVLTLQTREQHIRREKATSNICTNQALCATAAAVYMSLMGKQGLKQVALLSAERARRTAEAVCALDGFELYFDGPFVREFAVRTPIPAAEIIASSAENGVLPGVDAGRWYKDLDDCLLIATTEKRTDADIRRLVDGLRAHSGSGVLSRM